ncbi:hypothetical protein MRY82_07790 [bacterium]|nr:hypothetical protein [bacterium]
MSLTMYRFLILLLISSLQFACKNQESRHQKNADNKQITITKDNIAKLDGVYTMNFSDGEQNCALNYEKVDENFVYQFDQEEFQSEQLFCQSTQELELFCGPDEKEPMWHGSINKHGRAKLKIVKDIKKSFKNTLLQKLPKETPYNSVVLDFIMVLDFSKKTQSQGHLQLNYVLPFEQQTLSCKTKLPFDLNKEKQ